MSNKPTYTVLWETDTPFNNQYSIELNDSIDNYDEIICYGSANRGGNDRVNVKSTYPVISGTINLVGPYTLNTWQSTNYYMLNNGTQMYLSGTSGYIDVSYYWGMQNGGTGFEANRYTTARNADVHPYKIVGVKHAHADKIWETTGNTYETNITLDEPITHFNKLLIYSSGTENSAYGVHLAKNVYTVQPSLINGCDTWGYSPWALNFKCNYLLGCSLKLSGNSGHVGSSYYWGIGNNNATWAAGKWTTTAAPRMLQPYVIYGIDRCPTYNFYALPSEGGSVSSNINPGYAGDIATITVTPESEVWKMSALNITGAELTGNDFMFGNSNVTAQAEFEHSRDLTLVNSEHGTLSADAMSGFSGDVVTVDATTDEGWYFTGLNVTGATATGNQFMFVGENVTAEGLYTDEGYPITYLSDEHVSLTGDSIYIPGSEGITLDSGYDTYYRISGYDITGGSIVDGKLVPTGPCTIRAVEKINYFTASGRWFMPSTAGGSAMKLNITEVSLCQYKTSNVPSNFLVAATATRNGGSRSTNSAWRGGTCSGYKLSFAAISHSYNRGSSITGGCTGATYVGSTKINGVTAGGSYGWGGTVTIPAGSTTTTGLFKASFTGKGNGDRFTDANTGTTWTATGILP